MAHGADGAIGLGLFQHLIVPIGFAIGMQEEMGMQVRQSGQQRGAGKLDRFGSVARDGRPHRVDAFAAHAHGPAFMAVAVAPHAGGTKNNGGRLLHDRSY